MKRVLLPYATYGPYHLARIRVAVPAFGAQGLELMPVELFRSSGVYRWSPESSSSTIVRLNLSKAAKDDIPGWGVPRLLQSISGLRPDVVLINGWGLRHSLALHAWCRARGVARVLVSDSQAKDSARKPLRERLKSLIVRGCGSAFVAGTPQRRYLESLGFDSRRIFEGCDVVDNAHFGAKATQGPRARRLLTVARFDSSKNLLRACAVFTRFAKSRPSEAWEWAIAGYGALEPELTEAARRSDGHVRILGYVDYPTLPEVYAEAGAYWQPSVSEPWGLAVNEAMASGLPILASSQCGCHEDLVSDTNGWTFDPFSDEAMHQGLERAAGDYSRWWQMGLASVTRIKAWDLGRFADAAILATRLALQEEHAEARAVTERT